MFQITLKPLPPHAWDVHGSERVHFFLKVKAMIQKENVYSINTTSTSGGKKCRCSNDHKKNGKIWCSSSRPIITAIKTSSSYQHENHVVAAENFFWRDFTKRNIDGDLHFVNKNNNQIIVQSSTLHQMMCEWSYRVVDSIVGNRELVAISQNYLNRFLAKYHCNINDYKLVVITCLYLAIKVHNQRPLDMKSLVDLNGGEISIQDIVEMESMILKTLNWNLFPPTASTFCTYFFLLWPTEATKSSMMQSLLQRSCFFSELSAFDNSLVLELSQSEIAFAATLNAIEGLSPALLSLKSKLSFIYDIAFLSGLNHTSDRINLARDKIWALYQQSR